MPIYELTPDGIEQLPERSFAEAGVQERADLQRVLQSNIEAVSPDTLVIAEEYGKWDESRRRIDLLGVDRDGNLVVIELKRTEDGGHMELQALRYSAMVSTMTFDQAVAAFERYLKQRGRGQEDARSALLDFLEWEEVDEEAFAQDVRIVLVSAEFSKELTTTVLWLCERELDIRCVRLRPYQDGDRLLLDVQRIIPLPEADDYAVRIKEKKQKERTARATNMDFTRYDVEVGGVRHDRLPKRRAIFEVVRYLFEIGKTPAEISEAIPWRRTTLLLEGDGELTEETFRLYQEGQAADGKRLFRPRRWYRDAADLIVSGGKTYAFSNQWGNRWHEAMENLLRIAPNEKIKYSPSQTS